MNVTRDKNCYCYTCEKRFHYLGITRHRMAHKERFQDCKIEFTYGNIHTYSYSKLKKVIPN